METLTYVQRIAHHYARNMVPLPDPLNLAPEYAGSWPTERLRDGLISLHRWIGRIYEGAEQAPARFGLPGHPDILPRTGSRYTAAGDAFEALPQLIYALGLFGAPQERGGQVELVVDRDVLQAYCQQAKIKKAQALLDALAAFGLEAPPVSQADQTIRLRFTADPDIALALPAFAQTCRGLTSKSAELPLAFCRVDLRAMQPARGRKRPLPFTVADALRPLDIEQANILGEFDRCVELLGFRAECKCSGLRRGEWRGRYVSSRLGKTLFGFVVEEGQLAVRLMLNQTERILPYLAECPPRLRESFYEANSCKACGQCQGGPLRIEINGAPHRLCNYAFWTVNNVTPDDVGPLKALLEAQAALLNTDAKHKG